MSKSETTEKGFTLIEVIVTLALLSMVLTTLYSFYLFGLQSWQRGIDQTEIQQSARIAMDTMIRELQKAEEFSLHNENSEIRFHIPGDSRTMRFRLLNNELVWESYPSGSIGYFHNKVALGIEELSFATRGNLIAITLTAGSGEGSVRLSSSIRPRNTYSQPLE
ncbi:MAG: prepilin-type N-terminal cleavage/methylation domain-containing protein [Bacillota bacterium]|nr:prepilin-type N-terminal cleavage/methylation domain-containing protein [Bacillota bacterium]